jgi:copper transport protein
MADLRQLGQAMRGRTRSLIALILIACWSHAIATPVIAHAEVIDTNPSDGTVVVATPAAFVITFNEPIGLETESVKIFNAAGRQVDAAPEYVSGTALTQPLGPLSDGWYLATWRVISADGHVVESATTFGVGAADQASKVAVLSLRSTEAPLLWAVRFAADLMLLVSIGALFAFVALRVRGPKVARFVVAVVMLAAITALLWAMVQTILGGTAWLLTGSSLGGIVRILLLFASAATSLQSLRTSFFLSAVAMATMVVGGHPGATITTSVLFLAHLAAAGLWIGAAPALVIEFFDSTVADDEVYAMARRFSRSATIAILFVFAGGIALGLRLTDALAGGVTSYVLLLGAKLLLAGIALAGGAWTRRRLHSGTTTRLRLVRLFAVDAVIVVVIIGLSAALTLGSPHQGHDGHSGHCVGAVDGELVGITINPGIIGANRVLIGGIVSAKYVRMESVVRPTKQHLVVEMEASSGAWQGEAIFPVAGTWEVTIVVSQNQFSEARGSCSLEISP